MKARSHVRRFWSVAMLLCCGAVMLTGIASAEEVDLTDGAPSTTSTSTVEPVTDAEAPATIPAPPSTAPSPVVSEPAPIAAVGPAGSGLAVAQACEPSYPTLCLPPGADIDCGQIPQFGNFPVLPPDPFRLDGNPKDGIGCEGNTTGSPSDPSVTTTVPVTSPDSTLPPTTAPPANAPTTVAPPAVAGATQTNTAAAQTETPTSLPVTGSRSTLLAVLGFVVLALGGGLIATGGYLSNPFTGRLRGGFTVTTTNRNGEPIRYRVTSRK
jgi:hypothetical protein